ncbi:MAG: phosphoribosylamine--glycine ligase [Acidobacteriota bacterium]
MKVLVIGAGGRENALCWKLRQSPLLGELYCAPGNPGVAQFADPVPIAVDEISRLADFAADLKMDLTVVGPELPLTLGLADEFERRGLPIFGPSQTAAQLEGSKVFAKEFMARHGIPTSPFTIVHDADQARRAAKELGFPVVLKADGLAQGKGVLIPTDKGELEQALQVFFEERRFGASANRVIVERFERGEEVSFMALSDGERVLPLATSKDYKRIGDDDSGPNTGGMGSHSPSGLLSPEDAVAVLDRVVLPTVAGLREEGRPFRGVVYAGLMLTEAGPQVLEFNVRFGDPEAQSLLLRMDGDLLPVLAAGAAGNFGGERLSFRKEAAACLVLAAAGYPDKPVKGEPISGIERAAALPNAWVFHAGTAIEDGRLVSSGGRVLNVCATGTNLREALRTAYVAAAEIQWPGKVLRHDIGRRVLESTSGA